MVGVCLGDWITPSRPPPAFAGGGAHARVASVEGEPRLPAQRGRRPRPHWASVHLGALPLGFLLLAAVARGLADRARLAAAAHLAPFLVLHALLETALRHVLVDLRAAHLVARAHRVHGRFLAALERAHHRVDHAVVDQRLQACGGLHGIQAGIDEAADGRAVSQGMGGCAGGDASTGASRATCGRLTRTKPQPQL